MHYFSQFVSGKKDRRPQRRFLKWVYDTLSEDTDFYSLHALARVYLAL